MKKPYRKNLEGRIFGKLIVVEYEGKASDGLTLWYCRCNACGNYKAIRGNHLLSGKAKTCGCASITHGLTRGGKPYEYKSWVQIKGRCLNPNNAAYKDYGGRGITMCQRWQDSFVDFLADMGKRPYKTSIERMDNNKGYEPGNCRWATAREQANNRRSSVLIHAMGKTQTLTQWSVELDINVGTLWARINKWKWPIEKALQKIVID